MLALINKIDEQLFDKIIKVLKRRKIQDCIMFLSYDIVKICSSKGAETV